MTSQPVAASAPAPKPFSKAMRSGVVGPATRGLLGALLFLLSTKTSKYFAWTITPALTAAALGANYWASTVLAILAARQPLWAQGRITISVALVFSPLMAAATFLHLGEFHLDSSGITLVITWFWVIAYGLYPIQLGVQLSKQLRIPGGDPPRVARLPPWVKAIFGAHAAVLIPMGIVMFAAPGVARPLWPWDIPPLSSQALGAWTLAFGLLALHAILEDDVQRIKVALWDYPVLGALQVIALLRFGEVVQWHEPGAWYLVAFLASSFVLGAYGYWATRPTHPVRAPGRAPARHVAGGPEASARNADTTPERDRGRSAGTSAPPGLEARDIPVPAGDTLEEPRKEARGREARRRELHPRGPGGRREDPMAAGGYRPCPPKDNERHPGTRQPKNCGPSCRGRRPVTSAAWRRARWAGDRGPS